MSLATCNTMRDPDFTILTPNAMLGYGYREEDFWYGVEVYRPAAIIVDSGSTDGGPYKLGMNRMTCEPHAPPPTGLLHQTDIG